MPLEQALAFLLFSAVAAITPGPSNVLLTATGAIAGVLRGMPCLLGVAVGMGLMMFLVAFGLGSVVLSHPPLLLGLKWCGAAFLLWLSWKVATASGAPQDGGRPVGFAGAFLFQWLNPKSWLVSTSASGTYLSADAAAWVQGLWFGSLFLVVAFASGFLWLEFGTAMRTILKVPERRRIFNMAMGLLLACSVLLIII